MSYVYKPEEYDTIIKTTDSPVMLSLVPSVIDFVTHGKNDVLERGVCKEELKRGEAKKYYSQEYVDGIKNTLSTNQNDNPWKQTDETKQHIQQIEMEKDQILTREKVKGKELQAIIDKMQGDIDRLNKIIDKLMQ